VVGFVVWLLAGVLALNAVALGAFAVAVAIEGRRRNLQLRRVQALRRIDGDRPRGERVVVPFVRPHAGPRDGRRRSSAGRAVAILTAGALLCGGTALAATPTRHAVTSAFVAITHGFTTEPRVAAEGVPAPSRSSTPPALAPQPAATAPPTFKTPSADMGTEPHYVPLPPSPTVTSPDATQAPADGPAAPDGVRAVAASAAGTIDVSWTPAEGATGYLVERSTDGVGDWVPLPELGSDVAAFMDEGLEADVTYYYRVSSIAAHRTSAPSDVASATTLPAPPPATVVTATPSSSSEIALSWTDVDGETGYRIERSTDGVTWNEIGTAGADVTTYTDGGLTPATTYFYRVFATNLSGDSPASEVAPATTFDVASGSPAATAETPSSSAAG
jgi:hypothetical protein